MSSTPYTAPDYFKQSFNCPICGAFASQDWHSIGGVKSVKSENVVYGAPRILAVSLDDVINKHLARCAHCYKESLWVEGQMVFPAICTAPLPNMDIPADIQADFEEARRIYNNSPRSAAALLRLCVQKLCVHLGEKGKNINDDIATLVKKGLPEKLQRALDSVRVIGNNAVHPGVIDLNDNPELTYKLFGFVNLIVDFMISKPKEIDEFYNFNIPDGAKAAIAKRDGNPGSAPNALQ